MVHIRKTGKNLTQDELDALNFWRAKEFQSQILWGPQTQSYFSSSEFFLLKSDDEEKLLAFARLQPVSVWLEDNEIPVWALGAVVATEQRQGWGTQILKDVLAFAGQAESSARRIVIGFCNPALNEFYRQAGFEVLTGGQSRFIYIDGQDSPQPGNSDNAIFFPRQNQILTALNADPAVSLKQYIPHW